MDLNKLAFKPIPRRNWEAFDLGISMVNKWRKPLFLSWFIFSFPVFLLLPFLMTPAWACMLMWLLKPWFERPVLYVLSHAVFGDVPSLKQVLKNLAKQIKPLWFSSLTYRRLSLKRAFNIPVAQLEGLQSTARAQRLRALHHGRDNKAGWWTILCVHIELALQIALFTLLYLLIPDNLMPALNLYFNFEQIFELDSFRVELLFYIIWYLSISIVAPFYVAGGFSAYLNRRILVEAWDIDINFRNLAKRFQSLAKSTCLALLICGCVTLSFSPQLQAAEVQPPAKIKTDIEAVLASEPFNEQVDVGHYQWKEATAQEEEVEPIQDDGSEFKLSDESLALIQNIALGMEYLLWALAAIVILYLSYLFIRYLANAELSSSAEQVTMEDIAEIDLLKQSSQKELSSHWEQNVSRAIEQGELRHALALMYRGTLYRLLSRYRLPILKGSTELECLNLLNKLQYESEKKQDLIKYFNLLTTTWIKLAWAHQMPSQQQVRLLLADCERLLPYKEGQQ